MRISLHNCLIGLYFSLFGVVMAWAGKDEIRGRFGIGAFVINSGFRQDRDQNFTAGFHV